MPPDWEGIIIAGLATFVPLFVGFWPFMYRLEERGKAEGEVGGTGN